MREQRPMWNRSTLYVLLAIAVLSGLLILNRCTPSETSTVTVTTTEIRTKEHIAINAVTFVETSTVSACSTTVKE